MNGSETAKRLRLRVIIVPPLLSAASGDGRVDDRTVPVFDQFAVSHAEDVEGNTSYRAQASLVSSAPGQKSNRDARHQLTSLKTTRAPNTPRTVY
jgi:hypothetical protein